MTRNPISLYKPLRDLNNVLTKLGPRKSNSPVYQALRQSLSWTLELQIFYQIHPGMTTQLYDQSWFQMREQLRSQLRDKIYNSVGDQLHDQLRGQLKSELRGKLGQ